MLFYQPQEFVNSLLLMRFGVKGFSVRDEWKIVPIELKNIMHSNCKPLLLELQNCAAQWAENQKIIAIRNESTPKAKINN